MTVQSYKVADIEFGGDIDTDELETITEMVMEAVWAVEDDDEVHIGDIVDLITGQTGWDVNDLTLVRSE